MTDTLLVVARFLAYAVITVAVLALLCANTQQVEGLPPIGIGWSPGGYPLGEYDPNMYSSEITRAP
jgi:hypothetical protein